MRAVVADRKSWLGRNLCAALKSSGIKVSRHLTPKTDCLFLLSPDNELLLNACKLGTPNVVLRSDVSVYGDAPCPFSETDPVRRTTFAAAELAAANLAAQFPATKIVTLRFAKLYGPGDDTLLKMREDILNYVSPELQGNGNGYHDWVSVADAIDAMLLASEAEASDVVNIGTGFMYTDNLLVTMWNAILGTSIKPRYVPRRNEQACTCLNIDRARRVLEWSPRFRLPTGLQLCHQFITETQ